MHVLRNIHRWLRPDGVLLDLHPEPAHPRVEVYIDGVGNVHLGWIDSTSVTTNIHRARETLTSIVQAGWFTSGRSMTFDFVSHFPSVDDWLRHREERRARSVVDPAIIERARELLSAKTGEVVVRERVFAARFNRSNLPER